MGEHHHRTQKALAFGLLLLLLQLLLPIASPLLLSVWVEGLSTTTPLAMSTPRAPPVGAGVYQEILPILSASATVAGFGAAATAATDIDGIVREVPTSWTLPPPPTSNDLGVPADLCFRAYNHGNGLNLSHWHGATTTTTTTTINDNDENENDDHHKEYFDGLYLASYRSLGDPAALEPSSSFYGVVKDTHNRQIVVAFQESPPWTLRDWKKTYKTTGLVGMRTPKKIASKMPGRLKDRVLVHEGVYECLFDNSHWIDGDQKYDAILDDIKPLVEEGYRVCVTGHGFGGALAQVFSFKLAGAGSSTDRIPRPVTCVTLGAPRVGTGGYRAAFEQLEADGLLRCLRIHNGEDPVPAVPSRSPGFGRKRRMEHTGIGLELKTRRRIVRERRRDKKTRTRWRRRLLPGRWESHSVGRYRGRLADNARALGELALDDLYGDPAVVGGGFLTGGVYAGYHRDEERELSDRVR